MAKMALVTDTAAILSLDYADLNDKGVRLLRRSDFLKLTYRLDDRATCETDPKLIQLLPYVTLVDRISGKIFTYARGGSGNENRLVGLYSIGLGGHIEEEPGLYSTLEDVITVNILRELNEEVGLEITAELLGKLQFKIQEQDYCVIYDPTNEVGRHHLCLWFIVPVDADMLGAAEHNIITKGDWLTVEELRDLEKSDNCELESWSSNCLNMLK